LYNYNDKAVSIQPAPARDFWPLESRHRHFPNLTPADLPNRYSAALCWRPVMHVQTWASYSALYRFGRLSL